MPEQLDQLRAWLQGAEDEHLECKEAKSGFNLGKLLRYCAALANERGGRLVLGVTDRRPRHVVGSEAFRDLERVKLRLVEKLHLRIDVQEVAHPGGRVLVFDVPSRPIGMPVPVDGAYWMRSGGSLVPMTPDMLRRIFDEGVTDFSAEICPGASLADLAPAAIDRFRAMWSRKWRTNALADLSHEQLLADAELFYSDEGVTYAALILFGTRAALGRRLAQSEVVFEYRADETPGPAQQREEHREGFFLFYNALWKAINLRNDRQHFRDGLFVWDIPTFNEAAVREAVLNAVSHRDYRLAGSVFVRQFPRRIEIVSPGGFPPGITAENILWKQLPRNRRIAETFSKCGLVERAGQGVDQMFQQCIREGKPRPDFSRTDTHQVWLTLAGDVQDPQFLRFLEKVGAERSTSFATDELLLLDLLRREEPVPERLRPRLATLRQQGIIEHVGRGRTARHILSGRFYGFVGKKGLYTRKRGLDRETNKQLLLKHIHENREEGSPLRDLCDVLPALTRGQVQRLLRDLKADGRVHCAGRTRAGRWFPGAQTE